MNLYDPLCARSFLGWARGVRGSPKKQGRTCSPRTGFDLFSSSERRETPEAFGETLQGMGMHATRRTVHGKATRLSRPRRGAEPKTRKLAARSRPRDGAGRGAAEAPPQATQAAARSRPCEGACRGVARSRGASPGDPGSRSSSSSSGGVSRACTWALELAALVKDIQLVIYQRMGASCVQATRRLHLMPPDVARGQDASMDLGAAGKFVNTSICEECFSELVTWKATLRSLNPEAAACFLIGWCDHRNETVIRRHRWGVAHRHS